MPPGPEGQKPLRHRGDRREHCWSLPLLSQRTMPAKLIKRPPELRFMSKSLD
jgi:hypothetical protein